MVSKGIVFGKNLKFLKKVYLKKVFSPKYDPSTMFKYLGSMQKPAKIHEEDQNFDFDKHNLFTYKV